MADIICKDPDCGAIIADPCVKTRELFLNKMDLMSRMARSGFSGQNQRALQAIDNTLANELSLDDHQEKFETFFRSLGRSMPGPLVFTLECYKGHRYQYTITCES